MRELINSIDVSHIAMLRLVAELLSMVRHNIMVHLNVILTMTIYDLYVNRLCRSLRKTR